MLDIHGYSENDYHAGASALICSTFHADGAQVLICRIAIIHRRRREARNYVPHPCCDVHPLAAHRHLYLELHTTPLLLHVLSKHCHISVPTQGQIASTIHESVPQRWLSENLCDAVSPLMRTRRAS